jgi:hypothetical protein
MISSNFLAPTYVDSFRYLLLQPGIRELKEQEANRNTLEIILQNLYRQVGMWRYDFSSLPQYGMVPDPGIPREEATEVYKVMDVVFADAFPAQSALSREEAAIFMEKLVGDVFLQVRSDRPTAGEGKEQLLAYMEKLLEAFEWLAAKPMTEA